MKFILCPQLSLQAVEGHTKDKCRFGDSQQVGSYPPSVQGMGSGGWLTLCLEAQSRKKEDCMVSLPRHVKKSDKQEQVALQPESANPEPEDP